MDAPVVVDAMGGDKAPDVIIDGAVQACSAGHGPVILIGEEKSLKRSLERHGTDLNNIDIIYTPEWITMNDPPVRAARGKRESSMHRAFEMVKSGEACAALSAGNSGAFYSVGVMTLRRMKGCDRPAIATSLPTQGRPTVLLDIGAHPEARATHLVQYALMGAAYASVFHKVDHPEVALLSNGTESIKGTEPLREAHRLLVQSELNYQGFMESRSLPFGCVDVAVTDGFLGNVVLKLCEGVVQSLFQRIKHAVEDDWMARATAPVLRRALRPLAKELDWEQVGAAPLLGLNGLAMVAHGSSTANSIAHAIAHARACAESRLLDAVREKLEKDSPEPVTSTSELPLPSTSAEYQRETDTSTTDR